MPVQSFSSIIGLLLALVIGNSTILLIVHSILFLLSLLGFLGYKKCNNILIISHGYLTSLLSLSLFLYQTIQLVIVQGSYLDFLLGLPFAVDFIVGVMSLHFLRTLWKQNEEISEIPCEVVSEEHTELSINLSERLLAGENCCVCKFKPAVMTLYSCGHMRVCAECSEVFIIGISKCPFYRRTITELLRV